jgi:hypothetical protein
MLDDIWCRSPIDSRVAVAVKANDEIVLSVFSWKYALWMK